jgi:hypothetical protein
VPGREFFSVLFLWTFRWFILRKPTVSTGDIYLFDVKLTPDGGIRFEDLEFIVDHFKNLSISPEGDDSDAVIGAWLIAGHHRCMPSSRSHNYATIGGNPGATMPQPEESSVLQPIPTVPQQTTIPRLDTRLLPEQLMAYQEERRRALQDNIEREAVRRRSKLTDERAAIVARLADLHQCESVLEAGQVVAVHRAKQQLPTFTRASQNVAAVAALLDMLPTPSTGEVGEVYQWLYNILGTIIVQQAEGSLQHLVEPSVSAPDCSMVRGGGARGHPRGSRGGNDFLADVDFSLQPVRLTRRSVRTSGTSTTLPMGR